MPLSRGSSVLNACVPTLPPRPPVVTIQTLMDDLATEPRCDFCGKYQRQVDKLVAGVGVYICNECVVLASETILPPPKPVGAIVSFDTGKSITVTQGITEVLSLAQARHEFIPLTLPDGRQFIARANTITQAVQAKPKAA